MVMAGILLPHADVVDMTEHDAKILAEMEGVCQRLSLSLYCPRCQALGNPDGVKGRNAPGDTTWTVTCGCTRRVLRRQP